MARGRVTLEDMSEAAAATPAHKTSPYGVLVFGLVVAFLGGMMATQSVAVGWIFVAIGGVMTQFGIIAAAVELAILRARER